MRSRIPCMTRYIALGFVAGISFGLLVLAGIFLLARPWAPVPVLPPTPSPSTSPPPTAEVRIASPSQAPSPTTTPSPSPQTYTVQEGDNLSNIAVRFDTSVQALKTVNGLTSDIIYPGQVLTIPSSSALLPTPVAPAVASSSWHPSILEGNLEAAYPAVLSARRFALHYTPGTEAAEQAQEVAQTVSQALEYIELLLDVHLNRTFDVYLAGSLFVPPDQAQRGRSFSARGQLFILCDGTGNPADRQYIVTHELTHLVAWNTLGRPSSALLSEGLAVYVGMTHIASSAHLPPEAFCTAYDQTGQLPRVSGALRFEGHIYDLPNYYTAGCFVRYLAETYGMEKLKQLYSTGNYAGVYGRSLAEMENEWTAHLQANPYSLPFPASDLIQAIEAVDQACEDLFVQFTGRPEELARYRRVDAARIALLEGRLSNVWACLDPYAACTIP